MIAGARRVVVLERVGDADNVGAIFRSAAALDADAVLLGPACADPLYRKAIRTSMGAALTLPFADADPWPGPLEHAHRGRLDRRRADTRRGRHAAPRVCAAAARTHRVALVVGHEGEGMSDAAVHACRHRVRIPVHASVDSLNVATAAAIALHELS